MNAAGIILAVPFRITAHALEILPVGNSLFFWKWAYNLSKSPQDASRYINTISRQQGIEAAREHFDRLMDTCPDGELASVMAWLEIQAGSDENASQIIQQAKEKGFKNRHMMLYTELYLSGGNNYRSSEVVDTIMERNDLPMEFTRAALVRKMWSLAEKKNIKEAEMLADRIIEIEEQPDARFVKWIACQNAGLEDQAMMHLEYAKQGMSDSVFNMLCAQGWLYMNDRERAMDSLKKAEDSGMRFAGENTALGRLAESTDYRNKYKEI